MSVRIDGRGAIHVGDAVVGYLRDGRVEVGDCRVGWVDDYRGPRRWRWVTEGGASSERSYRSRREAVEAMLGLPAIAYMIRIGFRGRE